LFNLERVKVRLRLTNQLQKQFASVRNNGFVRFFVPKAMPDDALSQIYSKTFYWTFLLVLLTGFIYYFVLADSLFVQHALISFARFEASIVGKEQPHEGGDYPLLPVIIFVPIAIATSWICCGDRDKEIPDKELKSLRHALFLWLGLPLMWAFIYLGTDLALSKEITLRHLAELVSLAYVFGQIGILLTRAYIVLLVTYGFSRNRH
jgi:hypothetical protein